MANLDEAQEEFETLYPQFYENLRDELDLTGHIDFVTAMLYLDTYYSARDNGLGHHRLNQETEEMAQIYFKYYYDEGLFSDDNMNRVFTHYYLASLLHDMYTKL